MKLYGNISKTEELDDGTIKVWGYVSSEAVDSDGETITAAAMKAAIPDYMKFGAVREMHGKSAAGTAIEINVEDDGRTYFGAHVVDSEAVKKVKTNVYKGFSIGGSVTARDDLNKSVITGMKLVEVSLVDRPANPDAVLTCYKAEKIKDEEKNDEPLEEVKDGKDDKDGKKKDSKDKEGEDEGKKTTEKSEKPMQKSLYSVSRLAQLLADVQDFANYSEFESEIEERNNAIPAQVMDAANVLAAALGEMVGNEVSQIIRQESKPDTAEKIEKITANDNLQKAVLAAGCPDGEDMADYVAKLAKRITELEQQPEPPKGSLKAIEKTADNGGDQLSGFSPITHQDGSLNEAATLIKAAHAGRL